MVEPSFLPLSRTDTSIQALHDVRNQTKEFVQLNPPKDEHDASPLINYVRENLMIQLKSQGKLGCRREPAPGELKNQQYAATPADFLDRSVPTAARESLKKRGRRHASYREDAEPSARDHHDLALFQSARHAHLFLNSVKNAIRDKPIMEAAATYMCDFTLFRISLQELEDCWLAMECAVHCVELECKGMRQEEEDNQFVLDRIQAEWDKVKVFTSRAQESLETRLMSGHLITEFLAYKEIKDKIAHFGDSDKRFHDANFIRNVKSWKDFYNRISFNDHTGRRTLAFGCCSTC